MGTCSTPPKKSRKKIIQQSKGPMIKQSPGNSLHISDFRQSKDHPQNQFSSVGSNILKKNQSKYHYELPPNLVNFIQAKKVEEAEKTNSQILNKSKKENDQVFKSAVLALSQAKLINSSYLDQMSKFSIQDLGEQDRASVLDMITSYGNNTEIFQSKYERQLLTTSEFQNKLKNVYFIDQNPAERFMFQMQLGKGSMCKVYRVFERLNPTKYYAVRIVTGSTEKKVQKFRQQIAVMQLCQSKNVISHHFTYLFQETLFMFTEYMQKGSLNKFIAIHAKNIPEKLIAYIIRQILKGLQVLHKRRQLHRDLKSDNILVGNNGEIKIGDFGFAIQFTKDKNFSSELVGTPAWMAPQLIRRTQYSESVDIWSLGIILVELCEGQPKYLRMKPLPAMLMIASQPPQTVKDRSKQLTDFLEKCLKKDPDLRETASELLQHPFILSIGSGQSEKKLFLDMYKQVPLLC